MIVVKLELKFQNADDMFSQQVTLAEDLRILKNNRPKDVKITQVYEEKDDKSKI